ncbi:ABC transporter ATP-binding protein [Kosmotoga pacifica]|uniref:ABC transporter domain-containing protein n=2 Tax=Kosmotoga pacifica TaxID=1330330 RepID=A0A0G2ZF63_9BACT|nr:ABC transporter ATP-binding protein [Kosmotoga pacifica]AKI98184.1 hypothetical protein IX53_01115 [Kosmotoga pacifica]
MIELRNVSKVYSLGVFGAKKLTAVDDVSFSINNGEIVSLIGESGSGKTTIGRMILRLISITNGEIHFNGQNITNLKGKELKEYYFKVQGVFQDPFSSFNPIFKADRVFSLLKSEFFPKLPESQWQEKVINSLESVGLNPRTVLNKFPHQLSGGQLQRMLIARALLLDSKLLVADEIISMLDASTRIDVLNILAELKKRGLSILFITHDLSLGYYVSDKSIILYRGSILEMGKTELVFSNPLHPYTRMLLESVPRLDKKWESFEIPERSITGFFENNRCKYYDRCLHATDECKKQELIEAEPNHYVACWRWNNV